MEPEIHADIDAAPRESSPPPHAGGHSSYNKVCSTNHDPLLELVAKR
jgi:hypothetical protein